MPVKKDTIGEIRRTLKAKERQLAKLQTKRDALLRQIEQVDREAEELAGSISPSRAVGRRKKAVRVAPVVKAPRGVRKARRGKPLLNYVLSALSKTKKPMRARDIKDAVVKAGYRSSSKDFYNIVATTLRNEDYFKRVGRGLYQLKG